MKQFLLLTFFSVLLVQLSPAASCVPGTLATYISLGATGCTIGGDTLANFQDLSGTAGSTEIGTSAVTITPSGGTYNPTITASVTESVSAPASDETMFTYTISGSYFSSETITLSNSSETPDGGVTDIQNYCENGRFGADGVSGCPGVTNTLLTLDGIQNQDSTSFGLPQFLSVTDDLVISGGTVGAATGGTIADQFTSVPEPAAPLISAAGLLFLAWSRSRFRIAAGLKNKGVNQ